MSPDEVARLQHQIEKEKKALQEKTGLAQEERDKAANELGKRESEILKAQWVPDIVLAGSFGCMVVPGLEYVQQCIPCMS